nr:MAG TPA: hypothetical protein [Caudoviricetes sp.]
MHYGLNNFRVFQHLDTYFITQLSLRRPYN